ncbi:uncharacterized protein LOC120271562 [Dioscorea cayenensis subsp. rotundata]|uniref:Uncharacterized protein LOC120271562 n=1 Tax=Dioscorea cayennensis subsp. rotundata TaxID=55577 RepID=A0AB40C334_DIOCR|nr:uncharacterized protein LOC120271562 [Dioscorea cayenensis subsp. rotundata]
MTTYGVGFFYFTFILRRDSERRVINERAFARYELQRDIIDSLIKSGDNNCIWELRMCTNTFAHLCEVLRVRGGLVQLGRVTIEEQVIVFLNILAHHTKNRSIQIRFSRSGQTISRYCYRVLAAVLRLQDELFVKPQPILENSGKSKWKWFKGCLGALDGTYIAVTPNVADRPRYRTRKGGLRCFGLLKKRWGILRSPLFYPIRTQSRMILACCLLHNFICINMVVDPEEFTPLANNEMAIGEEPLVGTVEPSNEWTEKRDNLAQEMWHDFRRRREH